MVKVMMGKEYSFTDKWGQFLVGTCVEPVDTKGWTVLECMEEVKVELVHNGVRVGPKRGELFKLRTQVPASVLSPA